MREPTLAAIRPYRRWVCAAFLAFAAALPSASAQSTVASTGKLGIPALTASIQPDTILHVVGGMMAGMIAASAASSLSSVAAVADYPLFLPAVGFSAALTAGIAKETLDSTGFGTAQWSDLFHTMIGGLIVAGMIAGVELSPSSGSPAVQRRAFALAGIGFAVPVGAAFAEEIHVYLARRSKEQ